MINSVRNTVLSVLNKNNYGYLSPSDFNLFAKQAQLDLFEDVFYEYNYQINKENARQSGTGYANISKSLAEVIESFNTSNTPQNVANNNYVLPDDWYFINDVYYGNKTVEKISANKIKRLLSSNLTAPTVQFPAYILKEDILQAYPLSAFTGLGDVIELNYIRYPKVPNWTYSGLINGAPLFNPSLSTYQDFELPADYEPDLVNKILQYAGVSIRENTVTNFGIAQEQQENNDER